MTDFYPGRCRPVLTSIRPLRQVLTTRVIDQDDASPTHSSARMVDLCRSTGAPRRPKAFPASCSLPPPAINVDCDCSYALWHTGLRPAPPAATTSPPCHIRVLTEHGLERVRRTCRLFQVRTPSIVCDLGLIYHGEQDFIQVHAMGAILRYRLSNMFIYISNGVPIVH